MSISPCQSYHHQIISGKNQAAGAKGAALISQSRLCNLVFSQIWSVEGLIFAPSHRLRQSELQLSLVHEKDSLFSPYSWEDSTDGNRAQATCYVHHVSVQFTSICPHTQAPILTNFPALMQSGQQGMCRILCWGGSNRRFLQERGQFFPYLGTTLRLHRCQKIGEDWAFRLPSEGLLCILVRFI